MRILIGFLLLSAICHAQDISGDMQMWHPVSIDFQGPEVSESDPENPFRDYRLNVLFSHEDSGKAYLVPGYFAADGDAANSGATSGNIWRVRFSPDETGTWAYAVSFRKGYFASVSLSPETGAEGGFMDGTSGTFEIASSDKSGRDFRAHGRLQVGEGRYPRFAQSGEIFLKSGMDAPENLLAYRDFDGTFHDDGHKDEFVKTWEPHVRDWEDGDPTWMDGKGKGLIGALNYAASEGQNAVSFLTLNIGGDDRNVFPYVDYDTWDRFDVSKLEQWEIVFAHAQKIGIFLHVKLQESENQSLLDGGGLGLHRTLYFRELIARFGHHLALNWNLGEENGEWRQRHVTMPQTTQQRRAMASFLASNDPYGHMVVIHNGAPFDDLLGPESDLTGISLQTNQEDFSNVHRDVVKWIKATERAGRPIPLAVDEPGDHKFSLVPDAIDPEHDNARKNALWGAFMGGAWGLEWYFGYEHAHSDLTCEDWRSRDLFWDQTRHALDFMRMLPVDEMKSLDGLAGDGVDYVFGKTGEIYALYSKNGGEANLAGHGISGTFTVEWYDPRNGGAMVSGDPVELRPSDNASIGTPPSDPDQDWVVLLKRN